MLKENDFRDDKVLNISRVLVDFLKACPRKNYWKTVSSGNLQNLIHVKTQNFWITKKNSGDN